MGLKEAKGPIYPSLALCRAVSSRHAYTLGAIMQFMVLIQPANISSPNKGIVYVFKMVHKNTGLPTRMNQAAMVVTQVTMLYTRLRRKKALRVIITCVYITTFKPFFPRTSGLR